MYFVTCYTRSPGDNMFVKPTIVIHKSYIYSLNQNLVKPFFIPVLRRTLKYAMYS